MTSSMLRRQLKNLVQNYSEAEVKVREATSNDPWGPSSTQMADLSDLTYNVVACNEIMTMLWKRLKDDKNWRHIHKSLTLLEYLLKTGDDRVLIKMKDSVYIVKALTEFHFMDKDGKDQGTNVREKAKVVLVLMEDDEKLKTERDFAIKTREKTSKGSAASSSSDTPRDPNYKPCYVVGASGLPSLDNIPSVADLTASFAARKEERLKQEAEKKESERRAKLSEEELQWEDAGKPEGSKPVTWREDAPEAAKPDSPGGPEAAAADPWGMSTKPPTDPWGAPARTEKDPFAAPKTPEDPANAEDPFVVSKNGDDPFAAPKDKPAPIEYPFTPNNDQDPFGAPKAASDPFSAGKEDPFAAPQGKPDPFTMPKDDPFTTSKDDPFNTPKVDPFTTSKDDPFNTPKDDPFNTPKDDPFTMSKDDPFNTPKDDPFKTPKDDPFSANSDTADPFATPVPSVPKEDPFEVLSSPLKDDPFGAPTSPPTGDLFAAPIPTTPPKEDPFEVLSSPLKEDPFEVLSSPLIVDPFHVLSSPPKEDPFEVLSSPLKEDPILVPTTPPKQDPSGPFSTPAGVPPTNAWEPPATSPSAGSDPWEMGAPETQSVGGGDPWGDGTADQFGDATKPDSDPWGAPAAALANLDDTWGSPAAPPKDSAPSDDPFGDGPSKASDPWGAPSNAPSNGTGSLNRHVGQTIPTATGGVPPLALLSPLTSGHFCSGGVQPAPWREAASRFHQPTPSVGTYHSGLATPPYSGTGMVQSSFAGVNPLTPLQGAPPCFSTRMVQPGPVGWGLQAGGSIPPQGWGVGETTETNPFLM